MDEFVEGPSLEDWIDTLDSNSPEESAFERLYRDLWQAVEDGNVQNVRSLLEQKADPNHEVFRSEEWVKVNYPPLHTACRDGNLEIAKKLVNAGANVDANDRADGSTPLHLACSSGCEEVVDYLIREAGCTVDVRDDHGRSPLDRILENVWGPDDLDLGLYLVSHGCGGDEGKIKLMCEACYWGRLDMVKELVELHKVDPNDVKDKYNRSPLHLACESGSKGVVEYLVEEANCDVNVKNKYNRSPLHFACENGNKGVVEYLVEKANCDVNVRDDDGQSPLDRVLEDVYNKDDLDLGLYLINHDCGDDEGKDELMCKACYWGRLDVVEELVELHQVNPNDALDSEEYSPLDKALESMYENGCFNVVVYLISHDCGDDTETAIVLAQACYQGRLDVVKELVEQYEVDPKDVRDVRSPLYLACVGGHKDVVEYLVEKAKCDVNVRDENNRSPLHLACVGGHKDVVEYLVNKANCDVSEREV